MKLNKIEFFNFRNLCQQTLILNPNRNYFIGENAQGKTNLLEGVFFLSRGKSFRPTEADSLIRFRTDELSAYSETSGIIADFQHLNFGYKLRVQIQNSKKEFFLNQKKVYPKQLQTLFPMVLFSPESLSVIKESAEQRRNLVDELVLSHETNQEKTMAEFYRALKARNRLLKDISKLGLREDLRLTLESLNQIYLTLATHMTQLRIIALNKIWADFESAVEIIFGQSRALVNFEYLISEEIANSWDEQKIFKFMQTRLAELQQNEYGAGHSLVGPQKHDIKFLFNENDTRFYCSQGQQRALILALKIAQIVYHHRVHQKYPILLLDDVLSELDENKRLNLMKFLGKISAQVLITATDFSNNEIQNMETSKTFENIFLVRNGNIEKLKDQKKLEEKLNLI